MKQTVLHKLQHVNALNTKKHVATGEIPAYLQLSRSFLFSTINHI